MYLKSILFFWTPERGEKTIDRHMTKVASTITAGPSLTKKTHVVMSWRRTHTFTISSSTQGTEDRGRMKWDICLFSLLPQCVFPFFIHPSKKLNKQTNRRHECDCSRVNDGQLVPDKKKISPLLSSFLLLTFITPIYPLHPSPSCYIPGMKDIM